MRQLDSDCALRLGAIPPSNIFCPQLAVNATNPPTSAPISGSWGASPPSALAGLASLAFISNPAPMLPLTVTQNFDPKATSYVYAVVEGTNTLDLFFENGDSTKNPGVVTVVLPLAVLAKGASTENSVVATLTIPPSCQASWSCDATVKVNLGMGKSTYSAASLGIDVHYFLGGSVNWTKPHAIYEAQIPLLINSKTDPFYFLSEASLPQCPNGINQISGYCNAFSQTNPPNGFVPKFLKNTVVGMAPSAAPQCPGAQPGILCPAQTTPAAAPVAPTFGFCASFSKNLAAAFFLAIGPDGVTYVSSPVDPAPTGAQYPGCPS